MNLSVWLWAAILILLGMILYTLWRLVRSPLPVAVQEALEKKEQARLDLLKEEWSKRLAEETRRLWEQVQSQVRTTEHSVSQKLQQANDTFAAVNHELGRLQEATKKVEEVGRSIVSLEDLLKVPKLRGGLGEFLLADLLAEVLPSGGGFYELQYNFSDGERVDAAIRLQSRLVPVDSKFPLEQFRRMSRAASEAERAECRRQFLRDVKGHIDAIAQKYIRPSEGTFDFALMYIPAENVYYETILRDEGVGSDQGIFQHAVRRRVIPVSPNSFYAYLQVILLGLRGLAVEQHAQEILGGLIRLQKELSEVRQNFDLTGKQLRYALDNFEKADRRLARFEDRLDSMESHPQEITDSLPAATASTLKEE